MSLRNTKKMKIRKDVEKFLLETRLWFHTQRIEHAEYERNQKDADVEFWDQVLKALKENKNA
jgi:hypothetical protein